MRCHYAQPGPNFAASVVRSAIGCKRLFTRRWIIGYPLSRPRAPIELGPAQSAAVAPIGAEAAHRWRSGYGGCLSAGGRQLAQAHAEGVRVQAPVEAPRR